MEDFFFSVGILPPGIFLREMFSFEIGLQDIFFVKSPIRSYLHQKSIGRSLIRASSRVGEDCVTSQKNVRKVSYSLAGVAGVRKGRGRKFGRETTRPESPSCFLSTGGPEKELGQTCVQSQSSHEIRIRCNSS